MISLLIMMPGFGRSEVVIIYPDMGNVIIPTDEVHHFSEG